MASKKTFHQFCTYALIGIVTNVLGFAAYLILTYVWGAPKLTMTALYVFGVSIGFFANRRFTFEQGGSIAVTGVRYLLAQSLGYLLNLVFLLLFVDWLHFPHQIVQAISIVVVAIFLFVVLQFFVFSSSSKEAEGALS